MSRENSEHREERTTHRLRGLTFDRITSVMNSIGTIWVFALLILINLDIGGRAIFNHPLRGTPEIVTLSIVACVFMQLAHTLKVGRLTRSELFLNWLGRRSPGAASFLQGVHHLVGAAILLILLDASLPLFEKAWRLDVYVGAQGDFMAPVWPVKLIILIGCGAAAIQFLLTAWSHFKSMKQGPVARAGGGSR